MAAHSIIPPSSAGIWGKPNGCTGWVIMSQTYPPRAPHPEAIIGDAVHEVGAELVQAAGAGNTIGPIKFLGFARDNGTIINDEMYEGAELYAHDVQSYMRKYAVFKSDHLGIERRVSAPGIHELSFGTVDAFLYSEKKHRLIIWDFKFGHRKVEAFENWQGINYAAGIIHELGLNEYGLVIEIRIVQPRAYHKDGPITSWCVKAEDLRAHFNTLETNAAIALGPDATTHTGEHCRDCTARHACPAALEVGLDLLEVTGQPIGHELPPDALGLQLEIIIRARKSLEYLETGFTEQVKALAETGVNVPGFVIEPTYGRQKWDKPIDEVIALGDMLDKDLRKPTAVTPKQAIAKGIDADVIAAYSTTPRNDDALVADDLNKAKRIFSL